jgi:hypothetical protein
MLFPTNYGATSAYQYGSRLGSAPATSQAKSQPASFDAELEKAVSSLDSQKNNWQPLVDRWSRLQ